MSIKVKHHGVTSCGCEIAKYRLGNKNSRFLTNNSLYVANDTRALVTIGLLIGTRMRSIEWWRCHHSNDREWPI